MRVTKPLDLPLLQAEWTAAGVPHRGAVSIEAGPDAWDLFTYDAGGGLLEPPPEAVPVVEAHTLPEPPPSKADILQDLLDSIDPDDLTTDALQIMLLVQQEMLRP